MNFSTYFFTSNSVVSVDGGARIFLAQDVGYPSYATGYKV